MPVRWRRIIEDVNATAERYLLCVSGGVDSMFMFDFFRRKCTRSFRVAHFNHGLRDGSQAAADLVRDECVRRGVEFLLGHGDPDGMRAASSLEAEARRQRYEWFDSVLLPGEMVVTAHHANDQLETVILRLMRGIPDNALRMRRITGNRYRPFLEVPKQAIVAQAQARRLRWVTDESNDDLSIERNWVRHVLVPQMMERRNVLKTIGLKERPDPGSNPKC